MSITTDIFLCSKKLSYLVNGCTSVVKLLKVRDDCCGQIFRIELHIYQSSEVKKNVQKRRQLKFKSEGRGKVL